MVTLDTRIQARVTGNPDRAGTPADARLLAVAPGMAGNRWSLRIGDSLDDPWLLNELKDLSTAACDPNPFFSPAILGPAASYLGGGKIRFLHLVEETGGKQHLRMFLPVTQEKNLLFGKNILRAWSQPYGPLSTPLIEARTTQQSLNGFADCVLACDGTQASALVFENLPKDCAFSGGLFALPALSDCLLRYRATMRAGFTNRDELASSISAISGKRKQRLRQARKKLEKHGTIDFNTAASWPDIQPMLEQQLQLEQRGWKGRNGTAILNNPDTISFATAAVESLANQGDCQIHSMSMNGRLLASMIMISVKGAYFPWKIAFDEEFSKFSVGNLLLSEVNELLLQEKAFRSLDSLASELNQTARRFWTSQLPFSGMVIGLGPAATQTALRFARYREMRGKMKLRLKQLTGRLL